MPYISTQEVAAIRQEIKSQFSSKNGWKFSISRRDHHAVSVVIKKAPISFENKRVNEYWVHKTYADKPAQRYVLETLLSIMKKDQKELVYDGDYGSVPNYYINLSVDIEL